MTNKQNKNKSSVNLVDAVLRLLGKNVPTLAIWESKGELVWLGSADMSKWLTDLDDGLKEDLRSKMVSDMVKLSNNEEELLANVDHVPVKTRASLIFKSLTQATHPSGTQLLPFPLSLSNKRQKLKYISDLIRLEAKEKKVKLVYGSEECKPSFWLEHLWSWQNLKGSVFTVEEKTYTGQGSWGEFLTQTIKCLLESRDLDPEKHVVDLGLKEKTMEKKKRIRGIHDCPAIIEKSIQNNVSIVEESVEVPNPMVDLMQDYHYIQDEFHPIQENPNNLIENSEPQASPESQQLLHELQNMPVYNQQMEPNTTMQDSPGPILDLLTPCTTQSLPNCQYYSQTMPLGSEEEVENSDHLGMLSAGLVEGFCCSLCLADDCNPDDIAICQSGHKFCRDCLVTSTEKILATGGDVVKCLGICDEEVEITQLRRVLGPSILSKLMGIRNEEHHPESCQDEASGNQSQEDTSVHYLKPRRTVGKSPFKIPTQVPNCNARKPKVARKELRKLQANDDCPVVARAGFLEIPGQVKGQLEGCLAQFNLGGGACLYRAAAQHCSKYCLLQSGVPVTHIELRNYANSKLLEWWEMFSRFFAWPFTVTCGAGENSRRISIPNQAAYFKFLKSEDALEAFCETEVDLWILSYILNTTVCVLTYNLPCGQGYEGCRYEWTYFPGKLDLPGRYACQAVPLYVLNEHLVHWMRVLTVEEAGRESGRDDVECDTDDQSPGQGLLSGTGVLGKKDSVGHRKKESAVQRKKEAVKSKSKGVKENKVESKSRSKSVKHSEKNPSGSCKESSNELTKKVKGKCPRKVNNSNKDKRRKIDINIEDKDKNGNAKFAAESFQVEDVIKDMEDDVAVAKKSDMYHVFPLKDESLMKLLEQPSPEETAKEESFEKRCKKISERKKRFDADMERLDISISEEKARHAQWKKRLAINRLRRKRIENELSQPFLEYLLQKNQDYFEKIMRRELYSARYESYLKNGVTRDSLRYLMISNPFTEDQILVCIRELNKKLEPSFKDQMSTEFVDKVILPECLIKIFMDFFSVDKELAEKMIDETPLNTVDMGSDDSSSGDD